MLIRLLQSFLNRSINIILDWCCNRNPMDSPVVLLKTQDRRGEYLVLSFILKKESVFLNGQLRKETLKLLFLQLIKRNLFPQIYIWNICYWITQLANEYRKKSIERNVHLFFFFIYMLKMSPLTDNYIKDAISFLSFFYYSFWQLFHVLWIITKHRSIKQWSEDRRKMESK